MKTFLPHACFHLRMAFLGWFLLSPALPAATLNVPSSFTNVLAAYTNAAPGDTLEIQPGLYLEAAPVLFGAGKPLLLQSAGGRVIIAPNTPPANDEFTNAWGLSGPAPTAYGANYSATRNDQDYLPESAQEVPAHFGKSVWWRWTAPSNGLVVATTFGSDFSAVLDVFLVTAGGLVRLAADSGREWYRPNEVGFRAAHNTDYGILVGGDNADHGDITLQLSYIEKPANDDFTNAVTIPAQGAVISGTSLGATAELPDEPAHIGQPARYSVWFTWTAPLSNAAMNYPVRVSTVGSDFDTALAVYTNDTLETLALVASNDNRIAQQDFATQLSFTAIPGATYHVALDGGGSAAQARDASGNYLLQLDPCLVELRVPIVEPLINTQTHAATFVGSITLKNRGLASTAPLQVRIMARAASDRPGIHRAPVAETNLQSFTIPAGLPWGVSSPPLALNAVCPPPLAAADKTNLWGVFALLDEQFGGGWLLIDSAFIGYGFIPEKGPPILSWGPGRPLPPALGPSEINSIGSYGLEGPPWATDGSTNQFFILVQLSPSGKRAQTNAVWSAAPLPAGASLNSSGVLQLAQLAHSTNLTIAGRFSLAGQDYDQRSAVISLYRRPQLVTSLNRATGLVGLQILDDTRLTYALEAKQNLSSTNWGLVQTVTVTNPNSPPVIWLPSGSPPKNFFRLRATP